MKFKKTTKLLPLFAVLTLFLSGCVQRTRSGKPYGWIYDNLAVPTQHALFWLSEQLGNNLGWAIILITFIVRLVLMPLMLNQSRKSTIQQEKMATIQPYLTDIQKRSKEASSQDEQMAINQEMMALYKDNNISMTGGIGCLPLLIQMPIFAALYAAIQYSPELSSSFFYGINLGDRSFALTALTFVIYAVQGYLSLIGLTAQQKKQMQSMLLISPIMTAGITYVSPAGLGLYFFVGGIFACLQTLMILFMRPRIKKQVAEQLKQNPIKAPAKTMPTNKNTSQQQKNDVQQERHAKNRQRNAGKQHRN
ncbi:preprotein translocase subunit YidC [Ligilactobacillus salitolerans]|uniref:Preprotein translocase subunit YidC n=1 Tax=Ligilactobacillus salitolerans TaxID=1808352 RepID=A0A401IVK4_9LACO|nr:membrane protein insertase YidC [Ligilactobacillus salitolerans]GBG95581.1 preprotein translocase subunit YidC [Ligilactobacillus salitolerans]